MLADGRWRFVDKIPYLSRVELAIAGAPGSAQTISRDHRVESIIQGGKLQLQLDTLHPAAPRTSDSARLLK
jgi:hypothetical protein